MIRKVVKILWIFIALISLVCVFIFFSIAKGWIGYMPPLEDLETLSEMQNDCKKIRKLEEKIGKEKYIVMSYNTDWDNENLPSRA